MYSRRKRFVRLLLLATTTSVVGCSSTRPLSSLVGSRHASIQNATADANQQRELAIEPSQSGNEPAVKQVSFDVDEITLVETEINQVNKSRPVDVVIPLDKGYSDETKLRFDSSQTAMTLADFEALALGNNPTIQELVATTQKAAGFRTQVGLHANPINAKERNRLGIATSRTLSKSWWLGEPILIRTWSTSHPKPSLHKLALGSTDTC